MTETATLELAPTPAATPVTWEFNSRSGVITSPANVMLGHGYAGNGKGLNNPKMEDVHNVGPIPRGVYNIGDFFNDPGDKGPTVCHLTPREGTNTFGRSGFMIHGDTPAANHTASEGCIVAPRFIRDAIAASKVRILRVV